MDNGRKKKYRIKKRNYFAKYNRRRKIKQRSTKIYKRKFKLTTVGD